MVLSTIKLMRKNVSKKKKKRGAKYFKLAKKSANAATEKKQYKSGIVEHMS